MERKTFDYKIADRKPNGTRPTTREIVLYALVLVIGSAAIAIVMILSRQIGELRTDLTALLKQVDKIEHVTITLNHSQERTIDDRAKAISTLQEQLKSIEKKLSDLNADRIALRQLVESLQAELR